MFPEKRGESGSAAKVREAKTGRKCQESDVKDIFQAKPSVFMCQIPYPFELQKQEPLVFKAFDHVIIVFFVQAVLCSF